MKTVQNTLLFLLLLSGKTETEPRQSHGVNIYEDPVEEPFSFSYSAVPVCGWDCGGR